MANHISAKKRIRRSARMEIVNKIRKNRVRSFIKKVELAIEKADKSLAQEAFKIAHDISVYSFTALAQASKRLMKNRNASLLTLSYLGAVRTLPNYNVMGVAKAGLESTTRYLANSLGKDNIRVNAISAGPVKTLAASGIKSFRKMLSYNASRSPLGRNITTEEVGNAGAFLCSDLASGITGEVLYVDAGFNITAMGDLSELIN